MLDAYCGGWGGEGRKAVVGRSITSQALLVNATQRASFGQRLVTATRRRSVMPHASE